MNALVYEHILTNSDLRPIGCKNPPGGGLGDDGEDQTTLVHSVASRLGTIQTSW